MFRAPEPAEEEELLLQMDPVGPEVSQEHLGTLMRALSLLLALEVAEDELGPDKALWVRSRLGRGWWTWRWWGWRW